VQFCSLLCVPSALTFRYPPSNQSHHTIPNHWYPCPITQKFNKQSRNNLRIVCTLHSRNDPTLVTAVHAPSESSINPLPETTRTHTLWLLFKPVTEVVLLTTRAVVVLRHPRTPITLLSKVLRNDGARGYTTTVQAESRPQCFPWFRLFHLAQSLVL